MPCDFFSMKKCGLVEKRLKNSALHTRNTVELFSGVLRCSVTWSVGSSFLGVEFWSQWRTRLELSFRKLGQVRHDGVFIHIRVDNLLGGDDLTGSKQRVGRIFKLKNESLLQIKELSREHYTNMSDNTPEGSNASDMLPSH